MIIELARVLRALDQRGALTRVPHRAITAVAVVMAIVLASSPGTELVVSVHAALTLRLTHLIVVSGRTVR